MRPTLVLVLALALVVVALPAAPPAGASDSGSISRDARGAQPMRDHDPLGGPPTPRLYALGQTTIFFAGVTLLVVAAVLGAYTLLHARRRPVGP
jgi:hypothetical protein